MSYELVSYHLASSGVLSQRTIPVFLAVATGIGVVASLVLGRMYDRVGIGAVVLGVVLSAAFSPLVFFGGLWVTLAGLMLLGVGYATQDTLLKVLIASVLPEGKRNLAFGLFYLGYGAGWLAGSVAAGLLYETSRFGLVIFAMMAQLASVPLFLMGSRAAAKA